MEITRLSQPGIFGIKLKGRMDAIWSDHVGQALAECVREGQHHITVDMAEVDYISSAGIRVLVLYSRQLKGIRGGLRVVNESKEVRQVLKLVGLDALLLQAPGAMPEPAEKALPPAPRAIEMAQTGVHAEAFELNPTAGLRIQWAGQPQSWIEGKGQTSQCRALEFSETMLGLGLGALAGGHESFTERLGEFLAAAGVAICLPADGSNKPDYVQQQGDLHPTVHVAHGIIGQGQFAWLLRFDCGETKSGIPFSSLVEACQKAVKSEAVGLVMAAETAGLVGASLRQGLGGASSDSRDIFAFPGVREWLSFTSETAFPNSVSLVVGFAGNKDYAAGSGQFRPLRETGDLQGHFHAAAFPFRPIRKGRVDLNEIIAPLFENEHVIGLLHLVNDWRKPNGAGESHFLRGACWCSPLTIST